MNDSTREVIELTLKRVAKKNGGDRYENSTLEFVVYVPQVISRSTGQPAPKLKMTIEKNI